ncbi:MAG: efflux RND transporter periplasmic adaptor subunit, partial [Thermoleophilia bacterium]|nr:efflux RND transporter periplasmic adaptor subunit [Thermoleophilia bacterium]
ARRAERAEGDVGIAAPAAAAADASEPPARGAAEQPAAAWAAPLARPDGCAQAMPQPGSPTVSRSEGA